MRAHLKCEGPAPDVTQLHPSKAGAEELMLFQLTRFACGGLAVGFTAHHCRRLLLR